MSDDAWCEFFDSHAPRYMSEVFTTDSVREAAFLLGVLTPAPDASVLDIGCGTGRHAVELARAGLAITGIDDDPFTHDAAVLGRAFAALRPGALDEMEIIMVVMRGPPA